MVVIHYAEQSVHGLQFMVGRLSVQELYYCTSKTPNIGRCSSTRQLNHFRSHPVRRTDNARLMECCRSRSDSEVCKLHKALLCCENIGPLDVAMYNTLLMEIKQSMEYLGHVDAHEILRKLAKVLRD